MIPTMIGESHYLGRAERVAGLLARLEAGEFAAALSVDSALAGAKSGSREREVFRLAAYAAAVDHDPATDFSGFVEDLWVMVASAFQIEPEDGDAWQDLSPSGSHDPRGFRAHPRAGALPPEET